MIISSQICVSKLQGFFTLGDGCWLPIDRWLLVNEAHNFDTWLAVKVQEVLRPQNPKRMPTEGKHHHRRIRENLYHSNLSTSYRMGNPEIQKYPPTYKKETPRNAFSDTPPPKKYPKNTRFVYFLGFFSGIFGVSFRSPVVGGIRKAGTVDFKKHPARKVGTRSRQCGPKAPGRFAFPGA